MTDTRVITATEAAARIRDGIPSAVKVAITDIDGLLRGKFMHRDKFLSALEDGFGLCDVVLGWDVNDQLYDHEGLTGWRTGFPDASVRIVPETGRQIPLEDDCWLFLGEFTGEAAAVCPRAVLTRVLSRADEMGFSVRAGFEYEFFVFTETPESVRAKHFQGLQPVALGNTGYSILRQAELSDFYRQIFDLCVAMDMPLEGIHEEMGAGVIEAAISVSGGMEAADRASLFKTYAKVAARRNGLMATFMAKWSEKEAGQSGHIHLSLGQADGSGNVFHDGEADKGISETMRHFIGGQQALMPEFCALFAPTVNSYRRLVPGLWAPTDATWGIDNRTCALRVLPGSSKSQRVEHRLPGADANPYLALAAALASGLHGIENRIEPDAPVTGNAYSSALPDTRQIPRTLEDAAAHLSSSEAARDWFGDAFVDHFAASRDWEVREFRRHITDWELARYFELI